MIKTYVHLDEEEHPPKMALVQTSLYHELSISVHGSSTSSFDMYLSTDQLVQLNKLITDHLKGVTV